MPVAKEAEEFVKRHFRDTRKVDLVKPNRGERGFDFRDEYSTIFIEAKGSRATRLSDIMFLMFTNSEHEKAKDCLRQGKNYQIRRVTGVRTDSTKHYLIPGKVFVDKAKPEIAWILPTNKKIIHDEFLIKKEHGKI